MASSVHTGLRGARKSLSVVARLETPCPTAAPSPARLSKRRASPSRHLTVDQYIRLLGFIEDEGGIVTLDEISRALPAVVQPISAVFDLCDGDILCADFDAALDGDMRVWRVDR